MGTSRTTLRLLLLVVVAIVPPLLLALIALGRPPLVERFGAGTVFGIFTLITFAIAAAVTVIGSRMINADVLAMLNLARHGRDTLDLSGGEREAASATTSAAYLRLGQMLDERNRQISQLAASLRASPIQGAVGDVVRTTLRTAVSVTGDATWTLAVLRSPNAALATGTYSADASGPEELTDVARWAATMEPDTPDGGSVRYGLGPWGAFTIVEVVAGEELRAVLTAPWEGRQPPTGAERELLALLGQNAAVAIEHALLVEQLRSQTEELNRMAAVQSDFLRGVTHDLQTPLTSIRALAAELTDQPDLEDATRADLETIGHQADRLRRMVAQLLTASRLGVGALEPRQEVFRPEPIVRRTWAALRASRPFELRTDGPPHLIVGDPDRFEQVLWALFDNAVKYSPAGSPIVALVSCSGTSHRSGPPPPRSRVAIIDGGAGMDAETQEHAFDQFYRSPQARRSAPDGSGVGLYAARGLIEAMGGSIRIDGRLGVGTTVTLELPAETVPDPSGPSPVRPTTDGPEGGRQG